MDYENRLNNLKAEYKAYQPFPNGHLAPRKGFYLIKEVRYESIGAFDDVPVAQALWSIQGGMFLENSEVAIQLVSLYDFDSVGDKHLTPEELIGKTILVRQGRQKFEEDHRGQVRSYYVLWKVDDIQIPTYPKESPKPGFPAKSEQSENKVQYLLSSMFGNVGELVSASEASVPHQTLAQIDDAINKDLDASFLTEEIEDGTFLDYDANSN